MPRVKYRRRPGAPRSDNFKMELAKKIAARDHDVNSVRRLIATIMAEEDVEPTLAAEGAMSVAAQVCKMPPPGGKKHGRWYFLWMAWRAWRCTKVQEVGDDSL